MIRFKVQYEKGTGKCLLSVQIAWEASWQFGTFEVVAKDDGSQEETFIKNVLKKAMPQYDEQFDVSMLKSGAKYRFSAYYQDSSGSRQKINDTFIAGDVYFEIPYLAHVFYFAENMKNGWHKIHVLVDGSLPKDCIRVFRNRHEYNLPASLPVGSVYTFRFKTEKVDDIKIKSLVRITHPIKSVENLEALYDKCNYGGNE